MRTSTYLLTIVKGSNPPLEMMKNGLKQASFTYTADKATAKVLCIDKEGQIDFNIERCIPSAALTNMFIVKGASVDGLFAMEGTYHPGREWGKLYIRKLK